MDLLRRPEMMYLYKDQCKWISNSTKFPLVGAGGNVFRLQHSSLLKTSFKLNLSSLDWNLAQLAWLPHHSPSLGVYIYWQHLPFPRGSFCLWSRKLEKTEGICSSDLHQGDTVRVKSTRDWGYPQVVVRYRF